MTAFSLALWPRALRFDAVTHEDNSFDATDEAFFRAAYDDTPASESAITLELDAEEDEREQPAVDVAVSQRLQARRARLTQAVAEIVATLALVSGTAGALHLVRGPAGSSPRPPAATSSPTF
jgi:hypothetical protein